MEAEQKQLEMELANGGNAGGDGDGKKASNPVEVSAPSLLHGCMRTPAHFPLSRHTHDGTAPCGAYPDN